MASARLVLLSRAARKIAPDKSRPERSRPDSRFPVKSAGCEGVAALSAASTSVRVISAEVISGDDRSTCRIMSCAAAHRATTAPQSPSTRAQTHPRVIAVLPFRRLGSLSADHIERMLAASIMAYRHDAG